MEQQDKKLHIRHIEIWIILFIVAVGAAIAAFIIGINAVRGNNKESEYKVVPMQEVAEIPTYGDEFTFAYYVSGTSLENRNKINTISSYYSDKLAFYYASFDEEKVYEHYPSIGRVNAHQNEEVELSELVYNTLYDAYQKTTNSVNYSLFSEPLHSYWYTIFTKVTDAEREAADPLNSEANRLVLQTLADYSNDRNHIDLAFLGNNKVKLTISDEYKEYLADYGLEAYPIGLNALKTSYIAKNIVSYLRDISYTNGYIVTVDGLVFQLDTNNTKLGYNYYDCQIDSDNNMNFYNAADIKIDPYSFALANRRFSLNNNYLPYYYIKYDNQVYYRSLYLDIETGLPHNEVLSTIVYGDSNSDILELSYINNEFSAFSSIDAIREYLSTHNLTSIKLVVGMNDKAKNIYYSESIKDYISLSEELDYNLIKI